MHVKRTTNTLVNKCSDCPWFETSMDGATCIKMEEIYGAFKGLVYPEGRDKIHPNCPLKN